MLTLEMIMEAKEKLDNAKAGKPTVIFTPYGTIDLENVDKESEAFKWLEEKMNE